jgi:hypothetical protein
MTAILKHWLSAACTAASDTEQVGDRTVESMTVTAERLVCPQ